MKLQIDVGAAVKVDFADLIFAPIEQRARKAKREVESVFAAGRRGTQGPYRTGAVDADRVAREEERAQQRRTKSVEKAARERVRLEQQAMREVERMLAKDNAARDRALAQDDRRRQHIADSAALRVSGGAVRNFGGLLRRGAGVAGDIARGAGIDTNIGAGFAARIKQETLATNISASGYQAGAKGAAGVRADPRMLMQEAQSVGMANAMDPTAALEGLSKFVAKTGDLKTGREVLGDMAMLSRATGTAMEDMVDAAGDVSANLGDIENKGPVISQVMRSIAGQGKLGAVEVKDMAVQMAKLAANAGQFEGDAASNIALLGAFAQEARQRGGASSATQAATSVASMVNTFKTPARANAFKAEGIDVYNKKGQIRNPEEIVVESLRKAGMDPSRFKKMFANVQGARAVEGFATIYRQAGGGEAGEKAVRAEFSKLKAAAMGQGEIAESFSRSMKTTEAQSQLFRNQIEKIGGDMGEALLPALRKLAPIALQLAQAFSQIVVWAASNPWKALFAAFGASMMKSMGAEFMRANTERLFGRMAGNMAVAGAAGTVASPVAGKGGGFMGNLQGDTRAGTIMNTMGAAMAITAMAVTLYSAGTNIIDTAAAGYKRAQDSSMDTDLQAFGAASNLQRRKTEYEASVAAGAPTPEAANALAAAEDEARKKKEALASAIAGGQEYGNASGLEKTGMYAKGLWNSVVGDGPGFGAVQQQAAQAEQLGQLLNTMNRVDQALTRTLKVEVTNQPPGAPPTAPPPQS
jgi:TP901 family phage tail tape measure protein